MFEEVDFAGKKVLITAGADGLGLEMARVFHRAGARVFVCDVNESRLAALPAELPGVRTLRADVSDEDSVAALFQAVARELGGLDVLVNNAGVAGPTGFVETLSKADWDRTLAVNITGQFLCARQAIPLLKASKAGVMINLSSAAGHLGFAGRSVYSASKWAVIGFTKSLAIELGPHGIRVNAILPGAVGAHPRRHRRQGRDAGQAGGRDRRALREPGRDGPHGHGARHRQHGAVQRQRGGAQRQRPGHRGGRLHAETLLMG